MPRKYGDRNAGYNFLIALQQLHLSAFHQRIVVLDEVAHAISLVFMRMSPLPLLHVVGRLGKSGRHAAAAAHRVPAAMVEVQMSVDDDVDVFGSDTSRGEILQQLGWLAVNFRHSLRS